MWKIKELIIIWRILKSKDFFVRRRKKEEIKSKKKIKKNMVNIELSGRIEKFVILWMEEHKT